MEHPADQVEGLARDNRVEVRVLFGALTKALLRRAFAVLGELRPGEASFP